MKKSVPIVNHAWEAVSPTAGPTPLPSWDLHYNKEDDPRYKLSRDAAISKYGDPRRRPTTQLAATTLNKHNVFNAGRCPFCAEEVVSFRDELSMKEYSISGLCQKCQDKMFKPRSE